ncbi:GGDEF domain-containing protein [Neptunicella marina]|uniref:diguanylate cyclase n=1 Tax=Neptunicella marina TaxID=2125989 RepID=A0A8J6J1A3_9ALTE|nr:GGDEF domain-containing protein [Neptunicella marina]MBC3767831.1 diguanylate cyclase [Neptunicella marina]
MTGQLVQNVQHRRDVMRLLLSITFFGGMFFGVLNLYRGLLPLAVLELVYGAFSLYLLRIVKHTPDLKKWTLIYLLPFFSIMMYALYVPNSSSSIFAWVLTIPVISYLLLGRRWGFWLAAVYITIGVVVYHIKFLSDDGTLNLALSVNVLLSACLMMTFAHVYEKNREQNEQRLLELAGTDRLTGLANRMKLSEDFNRCRSFARRHQTPLTLILLDLDYFKNINDQYGHHVGDLALCHVADFFQQRIRKSDLLARFGGEEFAILMTAAELADCVMHIDQLRQELQQTPLVTDSQQITITFSAGMASLGKDGDDLQQLLHSADTRLYQAKNNGRNCVVYKD